MLRPALYATMLLVLLVPTVVLAEESAQAKEWRAFFIGDWNRVVAVLRDGETTEHETAWSCKLLGAAIITNGESADGSEYASMMAWNGYDESLFEFGRSSTGDSWSIHFKPTGGSKLAGEATVSLADGRKGNGSCVIERTGDLSYKATFEAKLDDGSQFRVSAVNRRKAPASSIRFGKPTPLSDTVNMGDTWEQSVSADGLSLFLASNRAGGEGFDVYVATRKGVAEPWSNVKNLGGSVNGISMDGSPDISADGLTLYFNSSRQDGLGNRDLWMSVRATTKAPWEKAINLGEGVNSRSFEGWPTISRDGLELFFTSSRNSKNELFVSQRAKASDPWGEPRGLGVQGACPDISPDGRYLFFANSSDWEEDGEMDILLMKRSARSKPFGKPVRLGKPINTGENDYSPNLSADGKTFTFYSQGKIWQVPVKLE